MTINLEEAAWRQVLAVLSTGPWATVNPLIMEIGRQMQRQTAGAQRGLNDEPVNDATLHPHEGMRQ